MPKIDETWDGGYVRRDARGRKVYVIRRSVGGKRYEVSTRCTTATAAIAQLRRFEENPEAYRPQGAKALAAPGEAPQTLFLTDTLAEAFLAWAAKPKAEGGKGNGPDWIKEQTRFMAWWRVKLAGKPLARLSLVEDIKKPLQGVTSAHHRIATLKAFMGWLRKVEHKLTAAEDPTIDHLPVPQTPRAKKPRVIDMRHVEKVLADEALAPQYTAALVVQAGTGWHVRATMRFAHGGQVIPEVLGAEQVTGVIVTPREKDGAPKASEVSPRVHAAAKVLLASGGFTYHAYWKAIRKACDRQGVPYFAPGGFRHTVASYALAAGATIQQIATSHRHKDPRTTWRYIGDFTAPPKIPTPV